MGQHSSTIWRLASCATLLLVGVLGLSSPATLVELRSSSESESGSSEVEEVAIRSQREHSRRECLLVEAIDDRPLRSAHTNRSQPPLGRLPHLFFAEYSDFCGVGRPLTT